MKEKKVKAYYAYEYYEGHHNPNIHCYFSKKKDAVKWVDFMREWSKKVFGEEQAKKYSYHYWEVKTIDSFEEYLKITGNKNEYDKLTKNTKNN